MNAIKKVKECFKKTFVIKGLKVMMKILSMMTIYNMNVDTLVLVSRITFTKFS